MAKHELPEVIARCTMAGAAHGYRFEGELVQTVDARLLRRCRNELGPPLAELAFEPVDADLDLRIELARLRASPGSRNHRPLARRDRRVVQLELRIGRDVIKIAYPRPVIGDVRTDHPADRLFAALWGWPSPA